MTTEPLTSRSPPRTAWGRVLPWMAGALAGFSALAISVRSLSHTLGVFDILALRNLFGLLVLSAVAASSPRLRPLLRPRRLQLHVLRNVVHFAGQAAWAQSILLLPLALAFALEFTTPAWVVLFAVLVLREQLTRGRLIAVLLGFAGVLVILRPGLEALQPAALLMLAAAACFGVQIVTTKSLTRDNHTFAILFWMNAMQLPMNLIAGTPSSWALLTAADIPAVLGVGVAGLASHWCLTNAFRHGDAIVVQPMDFLRVPLIAFLGLALYGERLDPFVFLGAGLILAGIVGNLLRERSAAPA